MATLPMGSQGGWRAAALAAEARMHVVVMTLTGS
jgi:hypothetical protein